MSFGVSQLSLEDLANSRLHEGVFRSYQTAQRTCYDNAGCLDGHGAIDDDQVLVMNDATTATE
jgi:hypothetical protein